MTNIYVQACDPLDVKIITSLTSDTYKNRYFISYGPHSMEMMLTQFNQLSPRT